MKYYAVLVTGGDYFLTPCLVIKASDEESAKEALKANRDYRRYSIALDRITSDEITEYQEQGAHIAETPDDIIHAF